MSISGWPERREDITALTNNSKLTLINTAIFDRVFAGDIDTWDYQVSYMLWTTNRIAIAPRINLIENIGFGPQATHTTNSNNPLAIMTKMHADRLTFPLRSPFRLLPNHAYQDYVESFATRSLLNKILGRLGFNVS